MVENINAPSVVDELIQFLRATNYSSYPHELIEQVILQKEQSVPYLLDILDQFQKSPILRSPNDGLDALIALFILAKLREKRAFSYLAHFCHMPAKRVKLFFGDVAIEELSELLASTFDGDWNTLYAIASNNYLYEHARSAVFDAYVILYKYGRISRKQILAFFKQLFDEFVYEDELLPTMLILCCCEIGAIELQDQIVRAYDRGQFDEAFISFDDIKQDLTQPIDKILQNLQEQPGHLYIDDLYKSIGWLLRPLEKKDDDGIFLGASRNAPCPCGSGKKYKKCCLQSASLD